VLLASLLLTLPVGYWAARPVWRRVKQNQLEAFLERASEARMRKDFSANWALLLAAQQANPTAPGVLRGLAEYLTYFRRTEALGFWKALEQSGAMTRSDRLQWAKLALVFDRTDLARTVLLPLHQANGRDPEVLTLVAQLFEQDGDPGRARAAAEEALLAAPGDPRAELRLAGLQLRAASPAERARGKALLTGLVARNSPVRAEAGFLFLERLGGSPSERELLRRLSAARPEAPFDEHLLGLVLDLADRQGSGPERVAAFVQRHGLSAPSRELSLAAETLGRLGEPQAVLTLVPESMALADADLCRFRLGALAQARDAAGMGRLLDDPKQPLPEFATAIFRAGAAAIAGRTNEVAILWRNALTVSQAQPGALTYLARHAESVGALPFACEAWLAQLPNPVLAARAAGEVLRLANVMHDFQPTIPALERLVGLRPEAADARLSLAFARLMLNVPHAATQLTLAEGEAAFANRDFFRVTRALQRLRDDQSDAAANELQAVDLNWAEAPLSWRVVRVAVLGRSGQHFAARTAAKDFPVERLSAAETALVAAWLNK
jgi:hypothetical protein